MTVRIVAIVLQMKEMNTTLKVPSNQRFNKEAKRLTFGNTFMPTTLSFRMILCSYSSSDIRLSPPRLRQQNV